MIQRVILAAIALAFLAAPAFTPPLEEEQEASYVEDVVSASDHPARQSTSYILEGNRWLRFRIPPGQTALNIASNANVPASLYGTKDFTVQYSLLYRLVDARGNILREGSYSASSGFSIYLDDATGALVPVHFYRALDVVPLGSRISLINLEGFADSATELRLGLGPAEAPITDVTVRAYFNEKPPPYKLRYLWQRMSLKKKERLARGNIYPLELLSEVEKRNIIENRWAALAPLGIEGRDYFERRLYTSEKGDGSREVHSIQPRGVRVEGDLVGVILVPENGGCVTLEIEALEAFAPGASGHAQVTWFGEAPEERIDSSILLTGELTTYERDYRGGYLEIDSEEPVVVRAKLAAHPLDLDITPEPSCIPAYALTSGKALEFEIGRALPDWTPVRVDLRRMLAPPGRPPEATVLYQLLDAEENVKEGGWLLHDEPLSTHDAAVGRLEGTRVSEPSRRYFWIAPGIAAVRLVASSADLIVTVYTRPEPLPRHVRVPEDYLAFEKGDDGLRNWFLVRPRNYAQCLREDGEALVRVAERPPLYSEELLRGDFHMSIQEPLGAARGWKILTPARDPADRARRFSPALFAPITEEGSDKLLVAGSPGEARVSPRLIVLKGSEEPSRVELLVDGAVHFTGSCASRSSEMRPPPIPVGWRGISARCTEPCEVYLNHVAEPSDPCRVERIVHQLEGRGLLYRIVKETEGKLTLVARAFLPTAAAGRVKIRSHVRGGSRWGEVPVATWTFLSNIYDLRGADSSRWPVLSTDEASLAGGQTFFVTLGHDLRPGTYEILFFLEEGPGCWLQLVKVVSGGLDPRRFFMEEVDPDPEAVDG